MPPKTLIVLIIVIIVASVVILVYQNPFFSKERVSEEKVELFFSREKEEDKKGDNSVFEITKEKESSSISTSSVASSTSNQQFVAQSPSEFFQETSSELSETISHQRLNLPFLKGVWAQPGGEERALDNDIEKMKEDGVNIFAIFVSYEAKPDGEVKIVPPSYKWEYNPKEGYLNLIRKAHKNGLAVYLGMDFNPWWEDKKFSMLSESIRNKFLASSKDATLYWAEVAEREGVELFSPMNEPTNVLGKEEGIKWIKELLPEIREKFKGKTNVAFYGIEIGDFSSFGSITGYDYASVNVYAVDVSDKEFIDYIKNEVMPYMESLVRKYNLKGYLFGEMGVPVENKDQDKIFEEFFKTTQGSPKGYFLSGWGPKIMLDDPFPDMSFTDRPAEDIIKKWYTQKF